MPDGLLHTSASPARTRPAARPAGQPRPVGDPRRPGGAPVNRTPLVRDLLGVLDLAILLVVASALVGAVLGAWVGW